MRDKSHEEQIERWAEHVRTHDNWKEELKPFLDSQIIIARRVYQKLAKTPEGREKILMLKKLS
ncbi:MAG: hypothetical protein WCX73_01910 [Candidatus Pacearchaeota archaeon]|jgi:hypothetical protein